MTCIQETHIKQKDVALLNQPRVGHLYVSASSMGGGGERSSGIDKRKSGVKTSQSR